MLTFICCDFNTLCVHTYILDLMGGLFQLIYSLDNFKLYEYNILPLGLGLIDTPATF